MSDILLHPAHNVKHLVRAQRVMLPSEVRLCPQVEVQWTVCSILGGWHNIWGSASSRYTRCGNEGRCRLPSCSATGGSDGAVVTLRPGSLRLPKKPIHQMYGRSMSLVRRDS